MNPARVPLFLGFALLIAGEAHAASIGITPFTGSKTKTVQARVVQALEDDGHSVVILDAVPEGDSAALRKSAEKAGVTAIVSGNTVMKKKGWTLELVVRGAGDGETLAEPVIRAAWLPGLLKAIDAEGPGALKGAIEKAGEAGPAAQAEAEPAPEPEPEPAPASAPGPDEADRVERPEREAGDGGRDAPAALTFLGGARAFRRNFSYHQDVNDNLRPYNLDIAPAVFAAVGWYPGAHFTTGPLSGIGVIVEGEHNVGTSTDREDGSGTYSTVMRSFSGGLRYRHRLGEHEVGASGQFGVHSFEITGDTDPAAASAIGAELDRDYIPDVAYTFVRPGLDAHFGLGTFAIGVYVGYRIIQSTGDLGTDPWFPDATAYGVDAGASVGYTIAPGLSAVFGVDFRRYGVDMQSRPEDVADGRDVAGGAVDQYIAGSGGIAWEI